MLTFIYILYMMAIAASLGTLLEGLIRCPRSQGHWRNRGSLMVGFLLWPIILPTILLGIVLLLVLPYGKT